MEYQIFSGLPVCAGPPHVTRVFRPHIFRLLRVLRVVEEDIKQSFYTAEEHRAPLLVIGWMKEW